MWISEFDRAASDLYARFQAGHVSPGQMAAELPWVWRLRDRRDPLADAGAWRAMVDHVGDYFVLRDGRLEGELSKRPRLARRLFRGATPDRRLGMSWTANPDIARDFARNRQPPDRYGEGEVWVGIFSPSRLLGYIESEREYLVDAAGADIQPWSSDGPRWSFRLRGGT